MSEADAIIRNISVNAINACREAYRGNQFEAGVSTGMALSWSTRLITVDGGYSEVYGRACEIVDALWKACWQLGEIRRGRP